MIKNNLEILDNIIMKKTFRIKLSKSDYFLGFYIQNITTNKFIELWITPSIRISNYDFFDFESKITKRKKSIAIYFLNIVFVLSKHNKYRII